MKKEINKKTTYLIIGILIFVLLICWLLIPVCTPCTYKYNNRDHQGACTEDCIITSKWKVILFNTTGINFDYKQKSQILPKPF